MYTNSKIGGPSLFLVVIALALSLCSCKALRAWFYSPKIEVKCEILRSHCRFRNFGDPGEECVTLEVFHEESGRVLRSREVCSGHIERDSPTVVPLRFDGEDPIRLCMGENMERDFARHCTVSVVDVTEE